MVKIRKPPLKALQWSSVTADTADADTLTVFTPLQNNPASAVLCPFSVELKNACYTLHHLCTAQQQLSYTFPSSTTTSTPPPSTSSPFIFSFPFFSLLLTRREVLSSYVIRIVLSVNMEYRVSNRWSGHAQRKKNSCNERANKCPHYAPMLVGCSSPGTEKCGSQWRRHAWSELRQRASPPWQTENHWQTSAR